MAPASIAIPRLQLRSRQDDLDVVIQGALLLNLPNLGSSKILNFGDLHQAVVDQQLWINRVGPCWLRCSIYVGQQLIHGNRLQPLSDVIKQHEVWEKLGVRLEASEQTTSQISLSIQHPSLASSLTPPKQALTAELLEISTSLSFSKLANKPKSSRSKQTDTQTSAPKPDDILSIITQEPVEELDSLDFGDMAAIEAFLFASGWHKDGQLKHKEEEQELGPMNPSQELLCSDNFYFYLRTALDTILQGNKKKHYGVKSLDGGHWPGLIHLAPGVFHMHYLEMISSRARFLPTLATSLSRMIKAESPYLRQLVDSFAKPDVERQLFEHYSEGIISGIENKAWNTLLANSEIPKLRMPAITKRAAGETPNAKGAQKKARAAANPQLESSDTLEMCLPDSLGLNALETDEGDLPPTLSLFTELAQHAESNTSAASPSEPTLAWSEGVTPRQGSIQCFEHTVQPDPLLIWGDQTRFEPLDGSTPKFHSQGPAGYTDDLAGFGEGIVWNSSWDAILDGYLDS